MTKVAFERDDIERLLGLLDVRLRARGVSGSVYVVGGACIAMTVSNDRRTLDIDALVSGEAVLEEARSLAETEGIPPNWLNDSASPWIPPRPAAATAPPKEPGLAVHWAPPEYTEFYVRRPSQELC